MKRTQKNNDFKLTIITVCFNDLNGLILTHKSLIEQTCTEFEWIVVDALSTDGSIDFIKNCQLVTKYIYEKDKGIYDGMRKGLNIAHGSHVLFLNSGDTLNHNNAISEFYNDINGSDIYFYATSINSKKGKFTRLPRDLASSKYSVPAVQQSTIYKLESLKKIEWPEKFRICGDYSISVQFLANNSRYFSSNFIFSSFSLGGISTKSFVLLANEANEIQKTYLKLNFFTRYLYAARRIITGIFVFIISKIS